MKTDAYPHDLVEQTRQGNLVPFIGAGMSMPAGAPSWSELLDTMRAQLNVDFGHDTDYATAASTIAPGSAPALALERMFRRLHDPLIVAQVYEQRFGRQALVSLIAEQLKTLAPPTLAHTALFSLPMNATVTTNYDNLLELACVAVKRPYTTLSRDHDIAYWQADRLPIVKIHGSLIDPFDADSVVISRSDFDNFLERRPGLTSFLTFLMQARTLLLIGYSLSDPDFLLIHNLVWYRLKQHRRKLYWVTFDLPEGLRKYWNEYGVYSIVLPGTNKANAAADWLNGLASLL